MQAILGSQQLNPRIAPWLLLLHPRFRFRPPRRCFQSEDPAGVVLVRAGLCGQHRLYRSGEFCHQLCRRNKLRLQAALGVALVEPDGHPHPIPLRQAGHRDRTDAAAELPRAFLAAYGDGPVGGGRIIGPGHRPGRISGRGARLLPAFRRLFSSSGACPDHGDVYRRDRLGGVRLRHPGARAAGFQEPGNRHHGLCFDDRGLLPDRDLSGAPGLAADRLPHGCR
jgi:hypothetical protein